MKSTAHSWHFPSLKSKFSQKMCMECYLEHRSSSENGVSRVSTERSAVLTIYGHFFVIFKSRYLKKTCIHPTLEWWKRVISQDENVLWKLCRTFFGPFWDTDFGLSYHKAPWVDFFGVRFLIIVFCVLSMVCGISVAIARFFVFDTFSMYVSPFTVHCQWICVICKGRGNPRPGGIIAQRKIKKWQFWRVIE